MIVMSMHNMSWGVVEVPEAPNLRQLNMRDVDSNMVVQVVWGDEPLFNLISELSGGLTQEQKRSLADKFLQDSTGITLPTQSANGFGPQG